MKMRDFMRTCRTKTVVAAGIAAAGLLGFAAMAAPGPPYLPLRVQVGQKAPDFELPSAEGGTVSLSQFAGHNVLLDFYEGYW
jgi:hypothetical protein